MLSRFRSASFDATTTTTTTKPSLLLALCRPLNLHNNDLISWINIQSCKLFHLNLPVMSPPRFAQAQAAWSLKSLNLFHSICLQTMKYCVPSVLYRPPPPLETVPIFISRLNAQPTLLHLNPSHRIQFPNHVLIRSPRDDEKTETHRRQHHFHLNLTSHNDIHGCFCVSPLLPHH